jgi:hypothetical protein
MSGSGITIYVVGSDNPLNTTVTIDGMASTIALHPLADKVHQYKVPFYSTHSLSAAPHTLEIVLLDYMNSDGTIVGSQMRFDYAAVDDIPPPVVSTPPSVAGTATTIVVPQTTSSESISSGTSHSKSVVLRHLSIPNV